MKHKKILVVGAGFTGSVVARCLADAGHAVLVIDQRSHVAGNCHTDVHADSNVLVHTYGPHIFHTDSDRVWEYMSRFTDFVPYRHQVKTTSRGEVFSMPINLHTLNQLWGTSLSPSEAEKRVARNVNKYTHDPRNFEEQALSLVGREIYERFFKGYTEKQWGLSPQELPASILKRLPMRFSYDDNYFFHKYQGIPADGYTPVVKAILNHAGITVRLGETYSEPTQGAFDHTIWTGPLDAFFSSKLGPLRYRTLDFEMEYHAEDFLGCAVMNYPDQSLDFTRITEHKYFAPHRPTEGTVIYRERSRDAIDGDIPYYPVRLASDESLLAEYVALAMQSSGVTFAGRLGTYRYLDMDVTIDEALNLGETLNAAFEAGENPPVFNTSPLG